MLFREIILLLKTVLIIATCMCRAPAMLHQCSFMELDELSIDKACAPCRLVQVASWGKRFSQYPMMAFAAFLLRKSAQSGSGGDCRTSTQSSYRRKVCNLPSINIRSVCVVSLILYIFERYIHSMLSDI